MKTLPVLVLGACLAVLGGCSKESGGASAAASGTAKAASAGSAPDCGKVVDKIASLNPPDMRGPAERKLWGSMCDSMKPEQRTCVVGAATMDAMKACLK
jgi:hypothetical protein